MVLNYLNRAIATFSDITSASHAFDQLILAGFPVVKVFLVGHDLAIYRQNSQTIQIEQQFDKDRADEMTGTTLELKKGVVLGNALGGLTGLVLGLSILALPGLSAIAAASALSFTLISSGICTAAGGVVGGFVGFVATEKQAKDFAACVEEGRYLLIVNGTQQEISRAQQILNAQMKR